MQVGGNSGVFSGNNDSEPATEERHRIPTPTNRSGVDEGTSDLELPLRSRAHHEAMPNIRDPCEDHGNATIGRDPTNRDLESLTYSRSRHSDGDGEAEGYVKS